MSIFQVEEVIEIRGVRFRLKNRALFVLIQNGTIFRQKRPSSLPSNNFLSPSDMGNLTSLLTEIQLHILLYVAGGDIWREHGMRAHFERSKDLLSLALCSKDLSVSFDPFSIYVSRTQSDQPLLCILFQAVALPILYRIVVLDTEITFRRFLHVVCKDPSLVLNIRTLVVFPSGIDEHQEKDGIRVISRILSLLGARPLPDSTASSSLIS